VRGTAEALERQLKALEEEAVREVARLEQEARQLVQEKGRAEEEVCRAEAELQLVREKGEVGLQEAAAARAEALQVLRDENGRLLAEVADRGRQAEAAAASHAQAMEEALKARAQEVADARSACDAEAEANIRQSTAAAAAKTEDRLLKEIAALKAEAENSRQHTVVLEEKLVRLEREGNEASGHVAAARAEEAQQRGGGGEAAG